MKLRLPTIPSHVEGHARALGVAIVVIVGCVFFLRAVGARYAVEDWLIWQLLPIWGYALLFNLSAVAGGASLLGVLLRGRRLPVLEKLVYSMAVGVVLYALGLYVLGFACRFKPFASVGLSLALLAVGARSLPGLYHELKDAWGARPRTLPARVLSVLASGWGAACIVFLYIEALDVSTVNFDASWYHFPTAQDYARLGCIVPFPGENHRAYPHLASLLHTWARLVPGLDPLPLHWMLALHIEFSLVLWRIVGVTAAAMWMLRGRYAPGLWVVFFLYPSIFIYDQNIGGSADHYLGFFAVPMLLAAARFCRAFDWRFGALLGIVAGGHALTKYQAIYLLMGVLVVVVARLGYLLVKHFQARHRTKPLIDRRRLRRLITGPAVALGVALGVTAPHLVKNAVFYNNPVYPFAQSVFTNSYPKRSPGYYEELAAPQDFAPKYQGARRQLWVVEMLYEYSFNTRNRNLTEKRPYMGSLFSLLAPCLLLLPKARRLWFSTFVLVGAFFVWANTGPNDRYLLSFYDLVIALSAALLVRLWELGLIARVALVPTVALQLVWGGDAMLVYGKDRLRAAIELIEAGYKGKAATRFDERMTARNITAATPPDAVIFARNYKNLLGLERTVLSDVRAAQDYISYAHLKDARELYELLRSRGVTHLLYPDGKRRPVRWNNIVLFAELFHHHARAPQRFGDAMLAEMPTKAPEPKVPYLVLVDDIAGYPDGVYKVEQLDMDERRIKYTRPAPKPLEPLTEENAVELLGRVQAVAMKAMRLPPDAQEVLERDFERVERFKDSELHLRRAASRP